MLKLTGKKLFSLLHSELCLYKPVLLQANFNILASLCSYAGWFELYQAPGLLNFSCSIQLSMKFKLLIIT